MVTLAVSASPQGEICLPGPRGAQWGIFNMHPGTRFGGCGEGVKGQRGDLDWLPQNTPSSVSGQEHGLEAQLWKAKPVAG